MADIFTPPLSLLKKSNICLMGGDLFFYFYANKVYITIEEEEIRGEKRLASGEIRTRNKKRRQIELEIPFFDKFNQGLWEIDYGYRDFELVINNPELSFVYSSDFVMSYTMGHTDTEPYKDPDIKRGVYEAIPVIIKEKKIEFLNNHYGRKIVRLTLWEKNNWYFT